MVIVQSSYQTHLQTIFFNLTFLPGTQRFRGASWKLRLTELEKLRRNALETFCGVPAVGMSTIQKENGILQRKPSLARSTLQFYEISARISGTQRAVLRYLTKRETRRRILPGQGPESERMFEYFFYRALAFFQGVMAELTRSCRRQNTRETSTISSSELQIHLSRLF